MMAYYWSWQLDTLVVEENTLLLGDLKLLLLILTF